MIVKKLTAEALIRELGLEVLPLEGGHFRQTYQADETVAVPAADPEQPLLKPRSTAILYLLSDDPDSFSAIHRLPTDEIYHFYLGDPVELLLLRQDGESEVVTVGHDILNGQHVQFAVPAGVWQGSRLAPGGEFALMGTTMAPGFADTDYVPGDRDTLLERFPDRAELIRLLTR
ncbi:MAG: cupin domain-containing protein [Gammaproteobacteria bacterium]|nr:cupin domain-containing protein [Gammaproteobacteria bacterium]